MNLRFNIIEELSKIGYNESGIAWRYKSFIFEPIVSQPIISIRQANIERRVLVEQKLSDKRYAATIMRHKSLFLESLTPIERWYI